MRGERQAFAPNSPDWEIWQAFWSDFVEQFPQHTATATTSQSGVSGSMAGTVLVTVPYSTETVTTFWSTSIVTVLAPTPGIDSSTITTPSSSRHTTDFSTSAWSEITTSTQSDSRISPPPAISQPTSSAWAALPSVITPTSDDGLPPVVTANPTADLSSSNNATATAMGSSSPHKRAVIGGLSGAIAGLVFIGLLICLVLRLRRKGHDDDLTSLTEKAEKTEPRPPLKQKLTELVTVLPISRTAKDSPRNSQLRPDSVSPVSVDEDHRMIRMSTRHWPRPFVPGAGEGYRDSAPLGQLRVVNPDLSRPTTPRRSTETATSFMRKQREAFAGFVFTSPRPQSIVRTTPNTLAQDVPTIAVVDPTLSRECVATYASTPSFRSYPSLTSLPTVQQHPAEDPFLTPPGETEKQLPALPHEQVPATTSASGAASKTWNSLGSLLHPFRARSNTATSQPATQVRGLSHFSVSTNASRSSRRSDPFDLDRPSIRGSTPARSGHEFHREGHAPGWILYEGT